MTIKQQQTPQEIRSAIIRALRHGALDQYQIAADIGHAAFLVRGHLKALKRDRVVTMHHAANSVEWQLTSRGAQLAWEGDQLGLGDDRR